MSALGWQVTGQCYRMSIIYYFEDKSHADNEQAKSIGRGY